MTRFGEEKIREMRLPEISTREAAAITVAQPTPQLLETLTSARLTLAESKSVYRAKFSTAEFLQCQRIHLKNFGILPEVQPSTIVVKSAGYFR